MRDNVKVLVCGGRDFHDALLLVNVLDVLIPRESKENIKYEIVSGGAHGADTIAKQYAKLRSFTYKEFPANWDEHGKSAGYIRNAEMAEYIQDNGFVIAFWNYKSKGTEHMIRLARQKNIPVNIIYYT
jgi:hypothetical protein